MKKIVSGVVQQGLNCFPSLNIGAVLRVVQVVLCMAGWMYDDFTWIRSMCCALKSAI